MTGPHMPIPLGMWRDRAKCAGTKDPEFFFPSEYTRDGIETAWVRDVKAFCIDCPVASECLQEALDNHDNDGMFGGLTPKERRVLRKGRKPQSSVITTKPRVAPCGTPAAYRRHLRNGEPVDDQCRRAHNAENAKYPKRGDRKASA